MKKTSQLWFIIITLLCTFVQGAWAQFSGGSGTEADPYLISSTNDWNTLASNVDDGNSYKGKYFKLTADIKAPERVGTEDDYFQGTFDGAGHALNISYNEEGWWMAPFAHVKNVTIKRLHVTGSIKSVSCYNRFHGGIVGVAKGKTNIVSCRSSVEIKIENKYGAANVKSLWTGGLVGHVDDGDVLTIVNCIFDGKIKIVDANQVGGFVGFGSEDSHINLINCLFAPSSVSLKDDMDCSTFLAHNDNVEGKHLCKHYTKSNCFRTKKCDHAEGEDASKWSNSQLLDRLGNGWHEVDGKVVPDMTLENYRFAEGEGTEASPYQIASADDWKGLAFNISIGVDYNGNFFQLTNDIELEEEFTNGVPATMIGVSEGICFRGTFDGGGHTITLDYTDNSTKHYCGPFRFINGATIKNLHVTGTIVKNKEKHAGGFVGKAYGTNQFINCRSSVDIQAGTDGDGSHGGFIGDLRGGTTTMTGCVFDGKMRGLNGASSPTTKWGGLIGWVADGKKAKFDRCVFAPTEIRISDKDGCRTFARRDDGDDVSLTKCYYLQALGSTQGQQAFSISCDEHVSMTYSTSPESTTIFDVSGIDSYIDGKLIGYNDALYSGKGNDVGLFLTQEGDTPEGSAEGSFIATPGSLKKPYVPGFDNAYVLTMPNDNVVISLASTDWTGSGTEDDPYLIHNAEQWNLLAQRVNEGNNSGYSGKYFKLMSDITIAENHTSGTSRVMVGISSSDNTKFCGTFDGNGHTITLDITDASNDDYCAPFRYLKNGTIKNLHVAGTIVKTKAKNAGGLVGKAEGSNNITNCWSSVDIQFDKDGDVSSGGLIGELRDGNRTTLTNCLFDGKLQGEKAYCWGGFIGWVADGNQASFNNCLFNPETIAIDLTDGDDNSMTFARKHSNGIVSISNCYHKKIIKDAQGATDGSGYETEELRFKLGVAWGIEANEAVPIMTIYPLTGAGTETAPYLITSTDDWNGMAGNVYMGETYSGKFLQLTDDISISLMVGTGTTSAQLGKYSFSGTFDGGGNTLNFTYDNNVGIEGLIAPFRFVDGATIKDLHVTGSITTSQPYAAGIIGRIDGLANITNCRSSIVIDSKVNGAGYHGGLVGLVRDEAIVTGCVFDGELLGSDTNHCSGMVGNLLDDGTYAATVTFNDCLFAPTEITVSESNCHILAGGRNDLVNANNSFYTQTFGVFQGKQAYTVNADDNITMEGAGTITKYDVSGITGYLAGISYNEVLYAGGGDEVRLNLYTSEEESYDGYTVGFKASAGTLSGSNDSYKLEMPYKPVTISVVLNPKEWDGDGSEETPYLIYNTGQLDMLASRVNAGNGYSGKYFKLMDDIAYDYNDLGETESNFTAIGDASHSFKGHFDGDNHTVSGIRIYKGGNDLSADSYLGLFGCIEGTYAEVKNVVLDNTEITGFNYVGGIVGYNGNGEASGGSVTDSHVTSSVSIIATQNSASWHGGIAGFNKSSISRCTSSATITTASNSDHYGAICGENDGTLENNYYSACTVAGVENATNVGCNKADVTDNDGAVPALRDDVDNSTAIDLMAVASDFLYFNVSLNGHTLYRDGRWNTLCLPFDVYDADDSDDISFTDTPLEGATVYTLNAADVNNGKLTLDFADVSNIEAGKPYLIRWSTDGDNVESPVFKGVTISNVDNPVVTEAVTFKGTYSPVEVTSDNKTMISLDGNNTLHYPTADLNAFTAYFGQLTVGEDMGDLNLDGSVDVADITTMVNIVLNKATDEHNNADLNGNGSVTIEDVTILVNIILGKYSGTLNITDVDSGDLEPALEFTIDN